MSGTKSDSLSSPWDMKDVKVFEDVVVEKDEDLLKISEINEAYQYYVNTYGSPLLN